jgi:hypothetical protein
MIDEEDWPIPFPNTEPETVDERRTVDQSTFEISFGLSARIRIMV